MLLLAFKAGSSSIRNFFAETYYAHRRGKVLRFLMSLSRFQPHLLGEMQKLNSRKAGNNRDWHNGLESRNRIKEFTYSHIDHKHTYFFCYLKLLNVFPDKKKIQYLCSSQNIFADLAQLGANLFSCLKIFFQFPCILCMNTVFS